MRIGVPKEIKDHEDRVGLVPGSVRELVAHGHEVWVEENAGRGAGLTDEEYVQAGATIVAETDTIWAGAEMIVKVKEPLAVERAKLRSGQILFTYLHLAPDPAQAQDLMASGATCIAYETVTSPSGTLPLLTPMSEVAGRMSVQVGAHALENASGGRGMLLGGVPGVAPAEVLILGGGVSGTNATMMAVGMGADVTVVDRSADVLRRLTVQFGTRIKTVFSTRDAVADLVAKADLVIGTVLIPGAAAPKMITRPMLKTMKRGSVIVDVSIDRSGRLHRDLARDDPLQSNLCRRWRGALLRRQHARWRGPHLHIRPQQRHAALHPRARRQGLAQGLGGRRAPQERPQRPRRSHHASGGRRSLGARTFVGGFGHRGLMQACIAFALRIELRKTYGGWSQNPRVLRLLSLREKVMAAIHLWLRVRPKLPFAGKSLREKAMDAINFGL